ncbi:ATP-binding cassette domain-containing protein [Weissella cibaria]|uniref:ATP-binding cassette domain-containing protein n=1 Tax=Weissella cibaria TaxID=137591 RepID=UPI00136CA1FD|nr:excinuclease ABC subunit UvrA [Weissella cibaria]MYV36049.1 ATP-binding cassette domain-containing protein [Weissella cibaria]
MAFSIEVRGAKTNNLKNIDVDIPLGKMTGITGRSGSGKSSLAMGTLYGEGMRRYLNALSTYTRRRISQSNQADVTSIRHLPSALALRQRPQVPDIRSTVGTMTEALNVLRLMFSRLGSMVCPNGHRIGPTLAVAMDADMTGMDCPVCGVHFMPYGAEDFAFNSAGACPTCQGTGEVREINPALLINEELTIRDGAVNAWRTPGRTFMPLVAEAAGINIDVPYKDLPKAQQDQVLHGERQEYEINIPSKSGKVFHMDHAVFENAYNAIADSMKSSTNERTIKRLNQFYTFQTCPTCHGTRFNPALLSQHLRDKNIAELSDYTIEDLVTFARELTTTLPTDMQKMGQKLVDELLELLDAPTQLGLDYLTLSRAGNTLSTGELQRIQLGRTIRNETTGVLYVLDEPTVGLHPENVAGLLRIFKTLLEQGNTLVVVDHDMEVIGASDYVIEIGPGSGEHGGEVIFAGDVAAAKQSATLVAPYLNGQAQAQTRTLAPSETLFDEGSIEITVAQKNNLHDVTARFPKNRLTSVTGMSGAGKTTLILDLLAPGIVAQNEGRALPDGTQALDNSGVQTVVMVDSVPVGKNARSTVATYTNILDNLRKMYAALPAAKERQFTASDFSYNAAGACPTCGGVGQITMDVQYLPDVTEVCPTCLGTRYRSDVLDIKWHDYTIADLLALSVTEALKVFQDEPKILKTLTALSELGLDYLTLGESTPELSGGEAQRLKLVTQIHQKQETSLFIFDEPSVGLHPLDIENLLHVFDLLLKRGATIITIEHDLEVIANSDWIVDLGPGGGTHGGQIVGSGTPTDLAASPESVTGNYLQAYLAKYQQA